MFQSLTSLGIEKVYHVKQYKDFPHKRDNDKITKVCKTLEEAQAESVFFNEYDTGFRRYYVMDYPHQEIEATQEQEREYRKAIRKMVEALALVSQ